MRNYLIRLLPWVGDAQPSRVSWPARSTLTPGTGSGSRPTVQDSPWSSAFPPGPPRLSPPPWAEVCVLFAASLSRRCHNSSALATVPAMFSPFIGTMPMSDFPTACTSGLRPQAFPDQPDPTVGRCWDLPVLVHRVSTHAQGLRLRGTGMCLALSPRTVLPSPSGNKVGVPEWLISELNSLACVFPCQRFADALRSTRA